MWPKFYFVVFLYLFFHQDKLHSLNCLNCPSDLSQSLYLSYDVVPFVRGCESTVKQAVRRPGAPLGPTGFNTLDGDTRCGRLKCSETETMRLAAGG